MARAAALVAALVASAALAPPAPRAAAPAPVVAPPLEVVVDGPGLDPGFRAFLETESRRAHARASAWFRESLPGPVTVRWAADEDELRAEGWTGADPVAGIAIPARHRIVLVGPALAPHPDRLPGVLLHEFCHLLFARATRRAAVEPPRWIDEGIATWRSGDWDLGLAYRMDEARLLADASAAGSLLPFRRLDASFPEGPFFPLAYAQSRAFVQWLAERSGEDALRDFLAALDDDLDPGPAFERAFGTPLEAAESAWRGDLAGRGPLRWLPSSRALFSVGSIVFGLLMLARWVRVRRQLRAAPDDEIPGS